MMPQNEGIGCGRESDFRFRYVSITLQRLFAAVKRPTYACSTPGRPRVKHRSASRFVHLEDKSVPLSTATTQRRRAGATASAGELVEQGQDEPVAAHADRMAECDGAAVD